MTTTLISTYVEHLETKRRYRTRRRWRRGGSHGRRDAMVDLALGSHPSHSGEKAHKVGVACKKSCSQNIAWPRRAAPRRPRPAKHLAPSSGGTVAAVAAVWWRRPQNIITLTFITLFSVVVSPTMCHSLLYTGPVCTAAVPPPLHAPQFDRIFSFL